MTSYDRIAKSSEGEYTKYLLDVNGDLAYVLAEMSYDGRSKCFYTRGTDLVSQERDGKTSYYKIDSSGDNLDLHHAPQGKPASQVINGYDYKTGPVIALPDSVHENLPTIKGSYTDTAHDLIELTRKQLI